MSEQKRTPYQKGLTLEEAHEEAQAIRAALEETNAENSALRAALAEAHAENRAALEDARSGALTSAPNNVAAATEVNLDGIDPNIEPSELLATLQRLESGQTTNTPQGIAEHSFNPRNVAYNSPGIQQMAAVKQAPAGLSSSYNGNAPSTNVQVNRDIATPAETRRSKKRAARAERDRNRPTGLAGTHPANYSPSTNTGGLAGPHPANYYNSTNSGGHAGIHLANYVNSNNSGGFAGTYPADYSNCTMECPGTTGNFPYEDANIDPRLRSHFPTPNYGGPGYFPELHQNNNSAPRAPVNNNDNSNSSNGYFNLSGVQVSPRFATEYESPYTNGSARYFGATGYPHGRGRAAVGDLVPGSVVRTSDPSTFTPSPSHGYPEPHQHEHSDGGNVLTTGGSDNFEQMSETHRELARAEYLNPDEYWKWLNRICPELANNYPAEVFPEQQMDSPEQVTQNPHMGHGGMIQQQIDFPEQVTQAPHMGHGGMIQQQIDFLERVTQAPHTYHGGMVQQQEFAPEEKMLPKKTDQNQTQKVDYRTRKTYVRKCGSLYNKNGHLPLPIQHYRDYMNGVREINGRFAEPFLAPRACTACAANGLACMRLTSEGDLGKVFTKMRRPWRDQEVSNYIVCANCWRQSAPQSCSFWRRPEGKEEPPRCPK
jgi:hypothetical protein